MNANIHTPERINGESFVEYQERRKLSHKLVKQATRVRSGSETSRQSFRNALRTNGRMKLHAGSFGRGLMNSITQRQQAAVQQKLSAKQKGGVQ